MILLTGSEHGWGGGDVSTLAHSSLFPPEVLGRRWKRRAAALLLAYELRGKGRGTSIRELINTKWRLILL